MDQPEAMNTCACGCGEPTRGKWKRGHSARGEGGYDPVRHASPGPLPGPDSPEWAEDAGIIDIEEPDPHARSSLSGGPADPAQSPTGPPASPAPDEPPAHARRDWHAKAPKAKARPPRITAGIRGDIDAKISFALEIPGRIWAARDPLCGGTFVEQRPDISRSLTEIVCRSPQLVEWFTGAGGGFIVVLDLGAALFPVMQAVMAHHVYHSVELEQQPKPSDQGRYAA